MKNILALIVCALALAGAGHAQVQPRAAVGASARFNWPRTFAGQPDFEFSRAEVVDDSVRQKKDVHVPTMEDLLEDVPLDPLGLEKQKAEAAAALVSGTEVSGTAAGMVAAVPAAEGSAKLPELDVSDDIDLREFKSGLTQRVTEYLENWHPNLRTYELSYLLRSLTLNGVMTSPQRSAIINGTTYRVGEQLKATVTLMPSDAELLNVMEEQMPAPDNLTPAQSKLYDKAYTQQVAELARQKAANPKLFQRTFTLPVTVRAIQSRKVTLEFNGATYDLAIPFAM